MVRGDCPARRRHWSPHPLVLEVPLLLGTGLLPSAPMVVQVPEGSEAGQHDEQDAAGETHSQASHIDVSASWEWGRGERRTSHRLGDCHSIQQPRSSCLLLPERSHFQPWDPLPLPGSRPHLLTCSENCWNLHPAGCDTSRSSEGRWSPHPSNEGWEGTQGGRGEGNSYTADPRCLVCTAAPPSP